MSGILLICLGGGFSLGIIIAQFFKSRCLHDWEPVVERELPSKAEELKKNGEDLKSWRSTEDLSEVASKTFFAIVSCKKCGGIKQFSIET